MKREVQSLKSELRALWTGRVSTSEVRLPWTPEEKLRHESNGHAEYDNQCGILREVEWNFQTPTSSVLGVMRARSRECHFQRV